MSNPNPRTRWLRREGGLAQRLVALRRGAYPTAKAFAEAVGWSQSVVSRFETGERAPSVDQVRTWVAACGGTEDQAKGLVQMLLAGGSIRSAWGEQLENGLATYQRSVTELIAEASFVAYFENVIVPGPLQTATYTRAALSTLLPDTPPAELDDSVVERMARWRMLYDTSRRWELLMDESVLYRWPHGLERAQMRSQIHAVGRALDLPHVQVGLIPLGQGLKLWPQTSFAIYEDVVIIELTGGENAHFGGVDTDVYLDHLRGLWGEAVTEPGAVIALLDRAAGALR